MSVNHVVTRHMCQAAFAACSTACALKEVNSWDKVGCLPADMVVIVIGMRKDIESKTTGFLLSSIH